MAQIVKKEKEVMIATRKCRVKEFGESTAKPVIPGQVVVVPINDANYLVGIKCLEVYKGKVEPGEIDKTSEQYKAWENAQKDKKAAQKDEIDALTAELKETKDALKKALAGNK